MMNSLVIFTVLVAACVILPTSSAEIAERTDEIPNCCSAPSYVSTDGLDECFNEHKDKKKHEISTCGFQCFFKHHGVLKENGDVSKEQLLAKVEGFEGDWKQTSVNMIEECVAKYNVMKVDFAGRKKGGCNPSAGFINMCLGQKYAESCPADHWNDSELCNKVRSGELRVSTQKGTKIILEK